ncbi:hypothetical protein [Sanguibacter suarezii]|uniref:hypothetical protein n=1 Tax=Sanguibacter suarezii TaxID=60921 RepID=UPI0012F73844|nr:hypothetical protein [Sanguibacter suarezii]
MRRTRKTVVLTGSLVVVGVVGTIGAIGAVADRSPAEVAATSKRDIVVQENISQLEQNLTEIAAQQEIERTEGAAAFALPPGTSFAAPEPLDEIKSQISNLEATERSKSIPASAVEDPTLYSYEDGFFTSLMAIDWKCAWLSTGVAQVDAGKMDEVAETVEILHSFTSTEYALSFPDYDVFLTNHVDPLLKGDTAGAHQYLPNCLASTLVD